MRRVVLWLAMTFGTGLVALVAVALMFTKAGRRPDAPPWMWAGGALVVGGLVAMAIVALRADRARARVFLARLEAMTTGQFVGRMLLDAIPCAGLWMFSAALFWISALAHRRGAVLRDDAPMGWITALVLGGLATTLAGFMNPARR